MLFDWIRDVYTRSIHVLYEYTIEFEWSQNV